MSNIEFLDKELNDFLQKHPHLVPRQLQITRTLATIGSAEGRMYYLSVHLRDVFYELKNQLAVLEKKLKEF